jgi:hypothetical protein
MHLVEQEKPEILARTEADNIFCSNRISKKMYIHSPEQARKQLYLCEHKKCTFCYVFHAILV